jgi:type IV pilus assembly protein PilP
MNSFKLPTLLLIGPLLTTLACEDEVVQNQPITVTAPAAAPAEGGNRRARNEGGAGGQDSDQAPPKVEYQEEDFVETETSRDPFRAFVDIFVAQTQATTKTKRPVVLEEFTLDELKLIGIVGRIQPAKAMLLDPNGEAKVVHRNDYVGRAERVQVGTTSAEFEINWRVDSIRDGDIVLVREDPTNPDVPSATRVLALRPEDEKGQ